MGISRESPEVTKNANTGSPAAQSFDARAIKAISLDLDDTLWAVDPVIARAEQRMLDWLTERYPRIVEQFGAEGLRALREEHGRRSPQLSHDFTALRIASLEEAARHCGYAPELAHAAFDVMWRARNEVELYEDVLPALKVLAERYLLAAVTNGNADLTLIGLDHWFECCISAREVGVAKPDPAIYAALARRLDLPAAAILHVGDDPVTDVRGALSAGMPAVWINRGGLAWPDDEVAALEVADLSGLATLLDGNTTP